MSEREPILPPASVPFEKEPIPMVSEALRKEFEKDTITSLLDLDLYKLTMAQFAWKHFPETSVTYEFVNRTTSVKLPEFIPEDVLRDHLDRIKHLKISDEEIAYLKTVDVRGTKLFTDDYLDSLKNLELPDVSVTKKDGQYAIKVEGPWSTAIYWETLILSTVNELYYRSLRFRSGIPSDAVLDEGRKRLSQKVKKLTDYIQKEESKGGTGPYFMDFGTRRRFSGKWQEEVVGTMAKAFSQYFTGTSNVLLGEKLGIPIKGTFAHEMDMIFSGIFHTEDDTKGTFASHTTMLDMWYEEYGPVLSVALTDTYGSKFFFDHFDKEKAEKWIGIRQDSGDPIAFGEEAIAFYERLGIDPKEKIIIFSDGLDVDAVIDIFEHFKGRIYMIFGWGTTLTNDVGFPTLSLVVKATEANGFGTAKLSDNLAKAIGREEDKQRAIAFSGNDVRFFKECKV